MRDYFSFEFKDEELENETIKVLDSLGLSTFSNNDNAGQIFSIGYLEALSLTNENGKYRNILKEINNIKARAESEVRNLFWFEMSMLTFLISSKGSILRLFNLLKKYIASNVFEEYNFRVVWYSDVRQLVER